VFSRAQARAKKRAIRDRILIPIGTCAALITIFVGLVNFSPVTAAAMERIPGLQQLALFVSFSPSLSEAVDRGFAQPISMEQAIGDNATMRIEHVVVDGWQIHIFYTLDSSVFANMGISVGARATSVVDLPDCCRNPDNSGDCCTNFVTASLFLGDLRYETANSGLRHLIIGFNEPVPPVVLWEGEVLDNDDTEDGIWGRAIGRYAFVIVIDEAVTGQEIYEVNYEFVLEGQRMKVTTVELNPAHTRVNIETDWMTNTKQLQRLVFHMENERGERFGPPAPESGGIINLPAGGDGADGPWRLEDHFLETAFFSESESLTLVITGVEWIGMDWMGPDTVQLEEPIKIRVKIG
jgi:hypothetical protein